MVLSQAEQDVELRTQLLLDAASAGGGPLDVSCYRRSFSDALKSGSANRRDHARTPGQWARAVMGVVCQMGDRLPEHPAAVVDITEHALGRVDVTLSRIDDSSGWFSQITSELERIHLRACEIARPDPVALEQHGTSRRPITRQRRIPQPQLVGSRYESPSDTRSWALSQHRHRRHGVTGRASGTSAAPFGHFVSAVPRVPRTPACSSPNRNVGSNCTTALLRPRAHDGGQDDLARQGGLDIGLPDPGGTSSGVVLCRVDQTSPCPGRQVRSSGGGARSPSVNGEVILGS